MATNSAFLNAKEVYINVGKQVTSPTSKPPPQHDDGGRCDGAGAAETFLYR